MEQQPYRQPGSPIGPEVQQSAAEQPHRGVFGSLLAKVGIHKPYKGFGPEPSGKVVQQGGLITVEGAYGQAPAASTPAEAKTQTPMPRIEDAGFGAPTMPRSAGGEQSSASPYPAIGASQAPERRPFTGGSEAPQLTPEQAVNAFGPVRPNSVTAAPETPQPVPGENGAPVHNLPIGQPRV